LPPLARFHSFVFACLMLAQVVNLLHTNQN
jgi:hypothetical protein